MSEGFPVSYTLPLVDRLFSGRGALHTSDGMEGVLPNLLRWKPASWVRDTASPVWITDPSPKDTERDYSEGAVAWLIEPPCIRTDAYEEIERSYERYSYILTYRLEWAHYALPEGSRERVLWYPVGGTRLAPVSWGMYYPKSSLTSLVLSDKGYLPLHNVRHTIALAFNKSVVSYGPSYHPLPTKALALFPYHFHIAIENCYEPWRFTEALIDPLLSRTIPVYYGASREVLEQLGFDMQGIVLIGDGKQLTPEEIVDELSDVLPLLSPNFYAANLPAVQENAELARQYAITEDWIVREYEKTHPGLFRHV